MESDSGAVVPQPPSSGPAAPSKERQHARCSTDSAPRLVRILPEGARVIFVESEASSWPHEANQRQSTE